MKIVTPLSAAGLAAALLNLGAFLVPQAARAQDPVEVTFTAPGQSVTVGTDVLFDAAFSNPTTSTYEITGATFTATDPAVTAEVADGQISAFFDGADGAGDPFALGPGQASVPGVFELDLDGSLPLGQTISGSVGFDGYLEDGAGSPTGPSIEVASQSFSVVTAAPSGTAAPEPSSVAAFAFTGLGIAGLMLKARRRRAAAPLSVPIGPTEHQNAERRESECGAPGSGGATRTGQPAGTAPDLPPLGGRRRPAARFWLWSSRAGKKAVGVVRCGAAPRLAFHFHFADVSLPENGCSALAVGDLEGKGLGAAAEMSVVRKMLRYALYRGRTVAGALGCLNALLIEQGLLTGFCTLFVGTYDAPARRLTYVNCGQVPALVWQAGTGEVEVEELGHTGPMLGLMADAVFEQRTVGLSLGDLLVMFTDGLTDIGDRFDDLLGTAGVAGLLREQGTVVNALALEAAETAEALMTHVLHWALSRGTVRDDLCLLVACVE